MRRALPIFCFLTGTALGQSLLERFDRFDRDGDDRITRQELGNAPVFDRLLGSLDTNGDGAIDRLEVERRSRQSTPAAFAMPAEPDQVAHRDLRYDQIAGVDPNLLSLDLYVPEASKLGDRRPVVVMIHGGGWRNGDKASPPIVGAKRRHVVAAGGIYASINYRLSPQTPAPEGIRHPVHVQDCAHALAWIHDRIATYGGDPDRIHLMGHSAGGHLAALVATNERFLAAAGKDLSIIKSNVLLDPAATDVLGYLEDVEGRGMTALYRLAFGTDREDWVDASPRAHVEPGKSIAPTLLFYAGDRMALDRFGPELTAALTEAGSPSQAVDTVVLDHGQINAHVGLVGEPMTELIDRLHAGDDPTTFPTRLENPLGDEEPERARPRRPTRPRAATPDRDDQPPPGEGLVRFETSYTPGAEDAGGRFLGGTETMRLVAHRGMLFAAIGYWTDQPGDDPVPGGQILVKTGPDEPWELDRSFPGSLRVNCLQTVTFRTDHAGAALEEPVTLLLADASPIRLHGRSGRLACLVRDDASGTWVAAEIAPYAPRAFTRAFGSHRDAATGVDLVFSGTGAGEIYAGAYDAESPSRIRWNPTPEYRNPDFDGRAFKRVSAFCVANDTAYCSVAPRLMERTDGTHPTWREVFRWEVTEGKAGAGLRGITAIASPDGDHEVILGARERPGKILRIDPTEGYRVELDLDSRAFAADLGLRGGGLTAYNRFVPGTHPETGEPIHWVTMAAGSLNDRAAWLLIRRHDATYEPVRVFDPDRERHPRLVSTRTIEVSPWDDRVVFTGGYDGAANDRRNHNTAWIFRGAFR